MNLQSLVSILLAASRQPYGLLLSVSDYDEALRAFFAAQQNEATLDIGPFEMRKVDPACGGNLMILRKGPRA